MFEVLESVLSQELVDGAGVSMADYTVLSNLVEATDRRWRMTDLAVRMRWSQSRLSHQIRRMERRGLVTREPALNDGRSSYVVLTAEGLGLIKSAALVHFRGVRQHMLDLLTPEQLSALGDVADAIVTHLNGLEPGIRP